MWTSAAIVMLVFVGCQAIANEPGGMLFNYCGGSASVFMVTSQYAQMDRRWNFECQPSFAQLPDCTWSGFFYAYDEEIHFDCKANHVITSVLSTYSDAHKDRAWNFLCCTAAKMVTYDCRESPKVNYFKEDFKWSVPGSNYMTGIRTYGTNTEQDHRWGFNYCRAAVLDFQNTHSQILTLNKRVGSQFTEGDIAVPLSRSAKECTDCRWTKSNGLVQVPYAISESFSSSDKQAIQSAMAGIHLSTCVRFVPVSGHSDYVSIEKRDGCWSYIGRTGGAQQLSLGPGCLGISTVQHELIHALGFWHEQSRTDRDIYVKIHWENIQEEHHHNFHQKETDNLNIPYDLSSLMHYGPKDFTKNGENTISPRDGLAQIGRGIEMSEKDVLKINKLYGCTDYLHKKGVWDNELGESLTKQCPSGQAVSVITSFHDDSKNDRLWGISCKAFVETKACSWSSYVNQYWEYIDFKCSENKVIAGIHSKYNGIFTDRQWKFLCCDKPDVSLTNCKDEPVIHYWGEYFSWKVASNNYLTGVRSTFDSVKRDRRWSFTYCQRKQQ